MQPVNDTTVMTIEATQRCHCETIGNILPNLFTDRCCELYFISYCAPLDDGRHSGTHRSQPSRCDTARLILSPCATASMKMLKDYGK